MNNFCDCKQDGWCPRYQRDMTGRFRQICAGIDCDLGTAAAFREQWAQEAGTAARLTKQEPIHLLLKTDQAPGDAVVSTAAIYSLHRAHPGRYVTYVRSLYPGIFQYNPDVLPWAASEGHAYELQMHYPAIHQSNRRGIHVMQAFCEHLGKSLGVEVPLLTNRPHLYLSNSLVRLPPTSERYWIVCSGGKNDFTNKLWGHKNYQEVVRLLKDKVTFVQVGEHKLSQRHVPHHQTLSQSFDMVGKTSLRDLFDLINQSSGVLCGVSLPMHIAAALEKPCVVVAGGREPVQWNAYPKQHYLHTVGVLPCYDRSGERGACWRSRVVPQEDCPALDEEPCLRPIRHQDGMNATPECMTLITPEQVADLILTIDRQYWSAGHGRQTALPLRLPDM